MDPRRILVTGASGFVGRHLLPLLASSFPGIEIFARRLDVTRHDPVSQAVRDARPDACIHLAAISSIMGAKCDPDQAWLVNLCGTLNLARALVIHAPKSQLLFASSSEIYRNRPPVRPSARRDSIVGSDEQLRCNQSGGRSGARRHG